MHYQIFYITLHYINELTYVLTFTSSSTNTNVKSNDGQQQCAYAFIAVIQKAALTSIKRSTDQFHQLLIYTQIHTWQSTYKHHYTDLDQYGSLSPNKKKNLLFRQRSWKRFSLLVMPLPFHGLFVWAQYTNVTHKWQKISTQFLLCTTIPRSH